MSYNRNKFILYTETWYQRSWRPMMAFVYMMLCVIDYGARPFINYFLFKKQNDLYEIISVIEKLEPMVQIKTLDFIKEDAIKPILSEFVHLAFGAILGVAAFSRGNKKNFLEGSVINDEKTNDNN